MISEWLAGLLGIGIGVGGPGALLVYGLRYLIRENEAARIPSDQEVAAMEHEVLAPRSTEAWGHPASCRPCMGLATQERCDVFNAALETRRVEAAPGARYARGGIIWEAPTDWQLESGPRHSTPIPERRSR